MKLLTHLKLFFSFSAKRDQQIMEASVAESIAKDNAALAAHGKVGFVAPLGGMTQDRAFMLAANSITQSITPIPAVGRGEWPPAGAIGADGADSGLDFSGGNLSGRASTVNPSTERELIQPDGVQDSVKTTSALGEVTPMPDGRRFQVGGLMIYAEKRGHQLDAETVVDMIDSTVEGEKYNVPFKDMDLPLILVNGATADGPGAKTWKRASINLSNGAVLLHPLREQDEERLTQREQQMASGVEVSVGEAVDADKQQQTQATALIEGTEEMPAQEFEALPADETPRRGRGR